MVTAQLIDTDLSEEYLELRSHCPECGVAEPTDGHLMVEVK